MCWHQTAKDFITQEINKANYNINNQLRTKQHLHFYFINYKTPTIIGVFIFGKYTNCIWYIFKPIFFYLQSFYCPLFAILPFL